MLTLTTVYVASSLESKSEFLGRGRLSGVVTKPEMGKCPGVLVREGDECPDTSLCIGWKLCGIYFL